MSDEEFETVGGGEMKEIELSGVDKLLQLQKTEKFVFHGSRSKYDELKPNVPKDTGSDPWQKTESVYADESAKSAFERMILHRISGANFYFDDVDKTAKIKCTREAYVLMMNRKVFIHVCDKKDFEGRDHGSEWKASVKIVPDEIIELGVSDYEKLGGGFEIVD